MQCDQCNMVYIQNGTLRGTVHESSCPNDGKQYDPDSDQWIRYVDCYICGYPVEEGELCGCYETENIISDKEAQRGPLPKDRAEEERCKALNNEVVWIHYQ